MERSLLRFTLQKIVDSPQLQSVLVVDISFVAQRQSLMVQTVRQTINFLQLLYKVVDVPVCRSCRFSCRGAEACPMVQTVWTVVIPQLQFLDMVIDAPVVLVLQVLGAVVGETVETSQLLSLRESSFPGGRRADMGQLIIALMSVSTGTRPPLIRCTCWHGWTDSLVLHTGPHHTHTHNTTPPHHTHTTTTTHHTPHTTRLRQVAR